MRYLIPLALILASCGLHKSGSGGAPAEVVGTYDAQCNSVSGSMSSTFLGTHRTLHVDSGGIASFPDNSGTVQHCAMHSVGPSLYQGQRDTGGGVIEELVIDLPHGDVRLGKHTGGTTTPVASGSDWTIVKTSSG